MYCMVNVINYLLITSEKQNSITNNYKDPRLFGISKLTYYYERLDYVDERNGSMIQRHSYCLHMAKMPLYDHLFDVNIISGMRHC